VVHELVVKHLQGHVQLEEDPCLVVTGIRQDRLAAGVARHVVDHVGSGGKAPDLAVGTLDDQELVPVVGVVELGILAGPSPVDGVEVVAGRAEVCRGVGIGLLLAEGRGVEGDVVVDELTDEREPRCQHRAGVLAEGVVVVLGHHNGTAVAPQNRLAVSGSVRLVPMTGRSSMV
jgi:hypothetical protein